MKTVRKIENFWLDLVPEVKHPMLDKAVEYGWLKKELVENLKKLETEGGKDAITKCSVRIGHTGTKTDC